MILTEAYIVFVGVVGLGLGYLLIVNHVLGNEEQGLRPVIKTKRNSYTMASGAMVLKTRAV
jgi:hypothetical protein